MKIATIALPLALLLPPAVSHAVVQADTQDAAGFAAMLMERGIEAYSSAGAHGDQAAADALLDDDILFSGGDGNVEHDDKRDRNDVAALLLKAQTVVLREAALHGDVAAMQPYLDSGLLAIDENGKVMEGKAYRATPPLSADGVPLHDSLEDWVMHGDDKVAVASYVDDQSWRHGNQTLHFRSLVMDTWIARDGQWMLLATHAIPLHGDATPAHLPASLLDSYAGIYEIGPGGRVAITHEGDGLLSSLNGAKPTPYAAELPDVFFATGMAPGSLRPHLYFERDRAGQVSGYASASGLHLKKLDSLINSSVNTTAPGVDSKVLPAASLIVHRAGDVAVATFIHERVTQYYGQVVKTDYRSSETWVKRGDNWKMLSLQSRALEREMPDIGLTSADAADYAGTYTAGSELSCAISVNGNGLLLQTGDARGMRITPVARDDFIVPGAPGTNFIFQRNPDGHVTGYVIRRQGQDLLFLKQRA